MSKLTVQDILGTTEGLWSHAQSLRDASQGKVIDIPGQGTGVLVDPMSLASISLWMANAANELSDLIPDGPLVAPVSKVRSRTLVRIVSYDATTGALGIVLPGWNPDVTVSIKGVPEAIWRPLADRAEGDEPVSADDPARSWAWVNLGAPSAEQLEFSDWENG